MTARRMTITDHIELIIARSFKRYGEDFATAMENGVTNQEVFAAIYGMIKDPHRFTFILAGEFGSRFLRWMNNTSKQHSGYILYPAGMRDGVIRRHTSHFFSNGEKWTAKACFVDAVILDGTARTTCLHNLYVPKDIPTFVAYDGMIKQQPWCRALYRYFDTTGGTDDIYPMRV